MNEIARADLRAALGSPCPYCGVPMTRRRRPSRDHLWPRSRGGTFADGGNRLIVCAPCNEDKGKRSLAAFAAALAAEGQRSEIVNPTRRSIRAYSLIAAYPGRISTAPIRPGMVATFQKHKKRRSGDRRGDML